MAKIKVGVLGATGAVGQRFLTLLEDHPWFEVVVVAASDRSQAKRYGDACRWLIPNHPLPDRLADLEVVPCEPLDGPAFYFSALPSGIAFEIEERFARAGFPVISNAASHRMGSDVPLLVPEVNPDHSKAIVKQKLRWRNNRGFIVTNPNCTVAGLVLPLDALRERFGLGRVMVTTFQAISGAGYPGVSALDIIDNVIPYIKDEEVKVETEPRKILGTFSDGAFVDAPFTISAQCARVNVTDGHLESVAVALEKQATEREIIDIFREYRGKISEMGLPSAPLAPLSYHEGLDRPQPKYDRNAGNGMTVTVGRLRKCSVLDYKFFLITHNMIRGAAGAAVLNAELLVVQGFLS